MERYRMSENPVLLAAFEAARQVRKNAHALYSNFKVGCVVLTASRSGEQKVLESHLGCNVENNSYGLTICAERNAIGAIVAAGEFKIEGVIIALRGGGSPCGGCRQVIWEFCGGNKNVPVFMIDEDESEDPMVSVMTMGELLPAAFEL